MSKTMNATKLEQSIAAGTTEWTARKRNFKMLPKAKDARIVVHGVDGKYRDGKYTAKRYDVEVDVVVNGKVVTHSWVTWVNAAGMSGKTGLFTSLEKAKALKKEVLRKWGKYEEPAAPAKAERKAQSALPNSAAGLLAAAKAKGISMADLLEAIRNSELVAAK